jgi:carboxylesterase type B
VQQTINTPAAPPPSGTDCLNLNVIVPDLDFERPLPVMVHIHGGGYFMGGNWWPQKDPTRLVALSVELGLPVIVVSMKYVARALSVSRLTFAVTDLGFLET